MSNPVTTMADALVTALATLSSSFTGIIVQKMARWEPANLPLFTRYCIIVAPANTPWQERLIGVRTFQYLIWFDLYLLVKNYDELNSSFGVTGTDLGVFELTRATKDLLRASRLGGILDKTYQEPGGPAQYEGSASAGFDSAEYSHVRRVQMRFEGRLEPFCQPISP